MGVCREVLGVYGELYGAYPFPGFALAEIPNSYGGGHGDQGFIMLYEDAFTKPLDREFVAHEIAHNWWGSLVSCADTEFPTEGSANYAQALYLEQTDGAAAFREAMKKQAEAVLIASLDEKPKSCYEADSGPLLYDKGAWILHMLRRLVGDEAWFATVKRFVRDHAGKVYTCAQFQEAFEQGSGQKLGWFFDQWLRGTDIPWVRGKLTNLGGGKVKLTLTQDKVKGGRDAEEAQSAWETTPCRMRLAVEVELRGDGEPVRKSVWLTEPKQDFELTVPGTPTEVAIDPDGWLLSHHRGLVSELDQEMQKLDEELKRELGDLDKDTE
jgi:aminopeptidase N